MKTSFKKRKLPPFASVNNMQVPRVPYELSCINNKEERLKVRGKFFSLNVFS